MGLSSEVANGVVLGGSTEIAQRKNLSNTSPYNFNHRKYLFPENLNAVQNLASEGAVNPSSATGWMAKVNLNARLTFKQKYALYPNRKVNYGSNYPKVNIHYQLGVSPTGSLANRGAWHFVETELFDEMNLGVIGTGEYSVKAGNFFGNKPQNFIDYKHFLGNQTIFLHNQTGSFQNLPYYSFSTNGAFLEAHYEHHFYGFFLNKLPLIKMLKWKEVAGINFLHTQNAKDYIEVFAGIDNIFNVLKIHFVSYYQSGQPLKPALRIGLRIN